MSAWKYGRITASAPDFVKNRPRNRDHSLRIDLAAVEHAVLWMLQHGYLLAGGALCHAVYREFAFGVR